MSKWHPVKVKIKVIDLSPLYRYLYFYDNDFVPRRPIRSDLDPKVIFDQMEFTNRVKCSYIYGRSMTFSLEKFSIHCFNVKCKSADDTLLLKMIYT